MLCHLFIKILQFIADLDSTIDDLSGSDTFILTEKVSDPDSLETLQASVELPKFKVEQRLMVSELLGNSDSPVSTLFKPNRDFGRMAADSANFKVDEIHHKVTFSFPIRYSFH